MIELLVSQPLTKSQKVEVTETSQIFLHSVLASYRFQGEEQFLITDLRHLERHWQNIRYIVSISHVF